MVKHNKTLRIMIGLVGVAGLVLIFLFQQFDVASWLHIGNTTFQRFVINRSIRFLLNDLFAVGLIYALFPIRSYLFFAVIVQFIGMIVFLLPYFLLKSYFPHYNGPLINFLHRLILNPVLLLLLIPAFLFQSRSKEHN